MTMITAYIRDFMVFIFLLKKQHMKKKSAYERLRHTEYTKKMNGATM